jgi:hemerythrin-like domain-containing protein
MHPSPSSAEVPRTLDGFEVLDVCHRHTVFTLGKLSALVSRLDHHGPDDEARALAAEIVRFFSTTSREHHEDEELHVFPKLLAGGDSDTVQAVQRLQQDHGWLEEDWLALSPQLDAIARGQTEYDLATLREGAEIFTALSHEHIALEESYIYPQVRDGQRPAERQEMGREMVARRRAHHEAEPSASPRKKG